MVGDPALLSWQQTWMKSFSGVWSNFCTLFPTGRDRSHAISTDEEVETSFCLRRVQVMNRSTAWYFAGLILAVLRVSSQSVDADTCTPQALVTLRRWFRSRQNDVYNKHYSSTLLAANPALRQLELFKNEDYNETSTCGCSNHAVEQLNDAYAAVDKELQKKPVNRLCRPTVFCTYDRDRYPPVIFQVKCGVTTTASDPIGCTQMKKFVNVYRRFSCTESIKINGTQHLSEKWKWSDTETILTGCQLTKK